MRIQNVAGAALWVFKMWRELLYFYHDGGLKIVIQEPVLNRPRELRFPHFESQLSSSRNILNTHRATPWRLQDVARATKKCAKLGISQ